MPKLSQKHLKNLPGPNSKLFYNWLMLQHHPVVTNYFEMVLFLSPFWFKVVNLIALSLFNDWPDLLFIC